ncbi:MAG TPA: trypsin-like peptidase domain-containing protein [Coleofasciculaceae cyanobacterium]
MIDVSQLAEALAAIATTLRQSTVQLRGRQASAGSGVIWQPDGLIITNAHVVTGTEAIAELWDGRTLSAQVIRHDPARDLAALRVAATDLPAAVVGESDRLRVGELVLAMGNPLGITGVLTTGIVHAAPQGGDRWIQADIQLAPGNSGGLLANAQGQVVGINSMIVRGLGVAIPSREVQQFLQEPERQRLGVTLQPVRIRGGRRQIGFLVLDVAIGSPVAALLQVGDVLLSVDGQPFRAGDALTAILRSKQAGDTLHLDFLRGDTLLSQSVLLQPYAGQEAA